MTLRFRQIRYFVEIVDAGSMNKAAANLGLVPNALSLQIKSLEENCGLRLLERHARGVIPTEAGRRFYQNSQRILQILSETERDIQASTQAPAVYRMGVIPSVIHAIGMDDLRTSGPPGANFRIDLVEGFAKDLSARLEAGDLDFAISTASTGSPKVSGIEMLEETLVYVTSSAFEETKGEVKLREIIERNDLIRFGNASQVWESLRSAAEKSGLAAHEACVIESTDLLRRMLQRGAGTAVAPLGLIVREWRKGQVAVHRIAGQMLARRISLYWRPASPTSQSDFLAVRKFTMGLLESYQGATIPFSRIIDQPTVQALTS